ncbi:hypothetical protein V6N11_064963 [Hibiscus sabdariffa]|uniref:Exo_endo_phos domain-containing protein n=1 Tax=Hibiscus sabdariffa TaxID=183260 RepID=A0ABR2SIT2_9ROSI
MLIFFVSEDSGSSQWRLTGFYGAPAIQDRVHSWRLLRQLHDSPLIPWCVIEDFNEILSSHEKQGGLLRNEWQMRNFREALEDCELFDLGYLGNWYTWEWGRTTANNIRERLDRGVANSAWENLFLNYILDHLTNSFSDHCPLLLSTCPNFGQPQQYWHFRFEASWLLESSCEAEVEHLWSSSVGTIPDCLLAVNLGLDRWLVKLKEKRS